MLSDIVKIKRERVIEWADKSKQGGKKNEMGREMCGVQRRRKIRSEDTAHIKRHRCTVGDCISDANSNARERVFVHRRHNRVSFRRYGQSDREIGEFVSLRLLIQNNLVDSALKFYLNSK